MARPVYRNQLSPTVVLFAVLTGCGGAAHSFTPIPAVHDAAGGGTPRLVDAADTPVPAVDAGAGDAPADTLPENDAAAD
jgi:hypothetical protein